MNDEAIDAATFSAFANDSDKSSAWLFLIDRSNPRRANTVAKNVAFVKSAAARANPRQHIGVATFASELQQVVELGDKNANFERRLEDVKADGNATEFFATALQAIELLKQFDADRRALVIMSDGKVEDVAYSHADVVKAAREANVVIYGMGYAERSTETPDLQVLRRLAEDTNGPFASAVGQDDVPLEFSEDFFDYLQNGGTVTTPLEGLSGELNASVTYQFQDGTQQQYSQSVFVNVAEEPAPVEPEPEPEPELTPVAKIYALFDGEEKAASGWAMANNGLATALLGLLGLAVLGLLIALFRRSRKGNDLAEDAVTETQSVEQDEAEPTTEVISDQTRVVGNVSESALGWFEMVDNQDDRFAITKNSIEIGRHTENDFRLNNDSVHRHHAHFHFSPDGKPLITDLDTVNGVVVNGTRVVKQELKHGDLIELGEVRFRYMAE
ncbi:MAG: FHA domain-containing protein [Pseudomonadota bacterium]